jgi:ElaB/YqjD/DUF883 family membrane-anchored ribosome-binding protein
MAPGADPLHERAYGTEGKVDRLEQLVNPLRNRLREAVGSLGRTLDRAGETLDNARLGDVRHLMERGPATALAVAATIGVLIGLGLASRR